MIYLVYEETGKIIGKAPSLTWIENSGLQGSVIGHTEDVDIKKHYVEDGILKKKQAAVFEKERTQEELEELWMWIRMKRNRLLAKTDYTQLSDSSPDIETWKAYRQKLRDITEGVNDPKDIVWPPIPA